MLSEPHRTLRSMPTVTLSRSDLFPVGTSVGIYPAGSHRPNQNPPNAPTSAAIASGTVDAAGNLSVTNAGILSYTPYVAAAQVNGAWVFARVRSTLDVHDRGAATGTGDTSSGANTLLNVTTATGAWAIGQRVAGPGIPPGTFIDGGSGASWTMTANATATGTGVALEGFGASPAIAGGPGAVGSALQPVTQSTRWKARVRQRRAAAGTS